MFSGFGNKDVAADPIGGSSGAGSIGAGANRAERSRFNWGQALIETICAGPAAGQLRVEALDAERVVLFG